MHNADEPLDRDIVTALAVLEYAVRPGRAESVIQEARSRTRQHRLRLAAAAVVMLSAIGVAALPGSPVRRWVMVAVHSIGSRATEKPAPQTPSVRMPRRPRCGVSVRRLGAPLSFGSAIPRRRVASSRG